MRRFLMIVCLAAVAIPTACAAENAATPPAIRPYGYLKFDAAYDEARVNPGDYARWVETEAVNKNDDELNATANQSRLGCQFGGAEYNGIKAGGKVEVDFYGGGAENKSNPMMRLAYVELEWPASDFRVLAGQTSDVMSPLVPTTVNYAVAWWAGDIGYRHPQLRMTKGFTLAEGSRLQFEAAAARTIGDALTTSPGDTGEDSGIPTFEGRVALTLPVIPGKGATVGFSGHRGREEYDTDTKNTNKNIETWSANVDLTLPLSTTVTLKGEVWKGENLDAFLGGVAQGMVVETSAGKYLGGKDATGTYVQSWGVRSRGGWASLTFGPYTHWSFNVGASLDDPEDADLQDGARIRNESIFGNAFYKVTDAVDMGFEVSQWQTDYKNGTAGDSYRVQQSFTYKF
jgi:hypothetical protein